MMSSSVTVHVKAVGHYFPVVLLMMLYKVVLTFESVDGTLQCDHQIKANEQYKVALTFIFGVNE